MEHEVWYKYPQAVKHLPDDVTFITTQELEDRYPDKTPKERENLITKEYGCVFLMKIGDKLASGEPHDGRAPDYDDWQLNGDILFWHDTLDCALEISSMGIRVDEKSLASQLKKAGCEDRRELPYHKNASSRRTSIHNRRRYWTVQTVYAPSRPCSCRRGAGKSLAGRDETDMQRA